MKTLHCTISSLFYRIIMKFISLPSTIWAVVPDELDSCVQSPCSQQETGALALSRCNPLQQWFTGPLALFVKHHPIQSAHPLTPAIFSQAHWTRLPASLQLVSPPHTRWLRLPEKHLPFQSERDRFFAKRSHPYHKYGGGMVAQWLALSFNSNKVPFLCLCGQFNVRPVFV